MSEAEIKQELDSLLLAQFSTYRRDAVLKYVTSAAQQGEVNGALAMRDIIKNEIMSAKLAAARYGDNGWLEGMVSAACYARDAKLPTPISDYLTAQLAEARAAQRESDAKLAHKEWACPNVAAAIRANVTPADAQYIERVRAKQ